MDERPTGAAAASLEWGVATLTLAGQSASGDLHLVCGAQSHDLVAVVDGLGHGEEAAAAAQRAVATIDRYAHEPIPSLVQRCHEALVGSRGVVMTVATFDPARDQMTWLGIGNVEGVLVHADWAARSQRTTLVTRAGFVGARRDPATPRPQVVGVQRGDLLVVATDGIRSGFGDAVSPQESPQRIAESVLTRYGKGTDDALVLVARYLGRR